MKYGSILRAGGIDHDLLEFVPVPQAGELFVLVGHVASTKCRTTRQRVVPYATCAYLTANGSVQWEEPIKELIVEGTMAKIVKRPANRSKRRREKR